MIGAIAGWCEALHGKSPLLRGLQLLGSGIDAEAVAVVRYMRVAGLTGARWPGTAPRTTCGAAGSSAAMPGRCWVATSKPPVRAACGFRTMLDDVSPDLRDFQSARLLRELVVIPLQADERFVDTIELHFADRLRSFQQHLLNSLAPVLSQTWKNRAQGLFTEAVLRRSEQQRETLSQAPILSSDNPARLSRAEYRVGLMLSRGMSAEEVREALNIRDSTLRTHLGNLYAKTRASNLSELVFLLVSATPLSQRRDAVTARLA